MLVLYELLTYEQKLRYSLGKISRLRSDKKMNRKMYKNSFLLVLFLVFRGVASVKVIDIGNGIGDQCSNSEQGCLHFTLH